MEGDKTNVRLLNRRTELNLTQAQVAKLAGITRPYYNMIENGKATPTLALAQRLARILRSGIDNLFYDEK